MKNIEQIYKEINVEEKNYNKLNQYISKLKQEINGDKTKLLLYKYECGQKTDAFGENSIWLAAAAIMIALLSVATNTLTGQSELLAHIIGGADIILVLIILVYYLITVNKKRKYELISLVLEEIEKDI